MLLGSTHQVWSALPDDEVQPEGVLEAGAHRERRQVGADTQGLVGSPEPFRV